jgi:uncharacterized cupin superfamily protein
MDIINLLKNDSLRRTEGQKNYHGAVLELAQQLGSKKLGFHLEIIDPKNFSCPYHWHTEEEEMFLVLEGEAIVRCNGNFRKVGPGDLIFYETGPQTVHNMYNHTDKPFRFLAISNVSENDACFYPDSKKQTSPNGILQNGEIVKYFKDEEDPAKYWPAHALRGEV